MMWLYILKLIIFTLIIGAMAVGALWLWRRVQPGVAAGQRNRAVKLVEAMPLGTNGRLAVVEFDGKRLLIAASRNGICLLTESDRPAEIQHD